MLAALLVDDPLDVEEPEPLDGPDPYVTVVLVAHDGAAWLPETLAAIEAQTRQPDHVIAVDTGSTDETSELLTRALGSSSVVTVGAKTGYGSAVSAGLAAHEVPAAQEHDRHEWIWLLHDDSAPDPTALARLLDFARHNPSVGLLGMKAVDWTHPDRLVEVGLTTDRAGRRITDLEHFELDQGQHDQPRDVLAVGTAGALIRRDVWDRVGGFDADLPLLREDIDLGWRTNLGGFRVVVVPAARVRHARATLTGVRQLDALPGSLRRNDRAHGLQVVLANSGFLRGGLLGLPQVLIASILRSLMFLVTRRPRHASDEITAALSLIRPWRLVRARLRRRSARVRPHNYVSSLVVRTGSRIRASLMATTDVFSGSSALAGSALPDGEDEDLGDQSSLTRRLLVRPVVGLVAGLAIVGLVTERSLLKHGTLSGGRLLPVTDSAREMWRSYAASWHPGGLGSSSSASPWEPVLATASLLFGGDPRLTVIVFMLAAFPLAGLSVWLATRRSGFSTWLRLWAAATYALLPPLSAAVDGGRFDGVVAIIGMPLLVSAAHWLLTRDPKVIGWNHPFAAGLGLALVAAFSPPTYLLAVLGVGVGALVTVAAAANSTRFSASRRAVAGLIMLAVPPALLFPYGPSLFSHPRQFVVGLGEAGGLAGQLGGHVSPYDLIFLRPGGGLEPPAWFVVPLLVAAGVGLVRRSWWRVAAAAAAVAVGGYAVALVVARTGAIHSGTGPYGWPGPALALAAVSLVLAALVGARRARETYATLTFGLRQPLGAIAAAAAIAMPFALGLHLVVSGLSGPIKRHPGSSLPPFISDDARRDPGQRLLALTVNPGGAVGYQLVSVDGARLGDEDLFANTATQALVDRAVADLVSNRGTDAGELLSTFHIKYVSLTTRSGRSSALATVLDTQPALSRFAVPGSILLWQSIIPSSRAQILSGQLAVDAQLPAPSTAAVGRAPLLDRVLANPPVAVNAGVEGVRTQIPSGTGDRVLVLADSHSGGWHATLNGHPLTPVTAWSWAQAFLLPVDGGQLRVWHGSASRRTALAVEASLLGVIVVLAAPAVRRKDSELDLEDES